MGSGHTFAQLVDEEASFVEYLARAQLWARWPWDDLAEPRFPAAPVHDFVAAHGRAIELEYRATRDSWAADRRRVEEARASGQKTTPNRVLREGRNVLHVGVKEAILTPRVALVDVLRGGVVKWDASYRVGNIVGATAVQVKSTWQGNPYLTFTRPRLTDDGALAQSHAWFEARFLDAGATRAHDAALVAPLKRALSWLRRRTTERVPLVGKNYDSAATRAVAAAVADGLRVCVG